MRLLRLLGMTVALFLLVGVAVPALASAAPAPDQPPAAAPIVGQLRGDVTLHDPALAKGAGAREWFVYSSGDPGKDGGTVQIRKSVDDGRTWTYLGTVWPTIPKWITDIVPDADTMWAPEIFRHGNTYYLYYAVSTLGHNDSVIALATNTTLDPKAPGYRWVDQGKVVRSLPAQRLQRHRSRHRPGRGGHALAGVRLLLERGPDGAAAVAVGQALRRPHPHAPARPQGPAERRRGTVDDQPRRLVLPVQLVGPVLRRPEEHLPHRRRAVQLDHRPLPRPRRARPHATAAAPRCWRR